MEDEIAEPDQMQALLTPDEFRAHPWVRFDADLMPIRAALTLCEASPKKVRRGALDWVPPWWTWLGGRPLVRADDVAAWPRSTDGRALTHVLQVDLGYEPLNFQEGMFARTGLPHGGLLQLFHDLETYGDPEDAGTGAWALRWIDRGDLESVPEADGEETGQRDGDLRGFELQLPPKVFARVDDNDDEWNEWERLDVPVPLNTCIAPTISSTLNLPPDTSEEASERHFRVFEWIEEFSEQMNALGRKRKRWIDPKTPWDNGFEPVPHASRLGGFGFVEDNPDYLRIVEEMLPLEPDDNHVLLIELNPAQFDTPIDWFHGLRPLQVWIRASDLEAHRFDDVWCLIRTDA